MRKILLAFSFMFIANSAFANNVTFDEAASKMVKENFDTKWKNKSDFDKDAFAKVIQEGYKTIHDNFYKNVSYEDLFQMSLKSLDVYVGDLTISETKSRLLIYTDKYELIGTFPLPSKVKVNDMSEGNSKIFATVVMYTRKHSPELKNASPEQLYYTIFSSILAQLDADSSYSSEGKINQDALVSKNLKSDYSFGFSYRMVKGGIQLNAILNSSNVNNANMKIGDVIVAINGKSLLNLSKTDVENLLSVNKKTSYKFSYYPYMENKMKDVYVANVKVDIPLVDSDLTDGVLTLYVNSFRKGVADDIYDIISSNFHSNAADIKGVVLDLRGNILGDKDEMLESLDLFYDKGIFANFVDKDGVKKYYSNGSVDDRFIDIADKPLVVLVDRSVKNVAEMFAMSMQFSGRAVVLGEATSGDALVYNNFTLSNGGELWIPTHSFYNNNYFLKGAGVMPLICSSSIKTDADLDKLKSRLLDGSFHFYDGDFFFREKDGDVKDKIRQLRAGCPYSQEINYSLDTDLANMVALNPKVFDMILKESITKYHAQ